MRYLLFVLLFSTLIFADEKANFEKLKKPLDEKVCKTNRFADCLAYKYIQHYHPNAKDADWYRNTSVNHYFDYKVIYQNEREKGEILFSFQSYSDGLEWNYWEESIIMRIKDPLNLIDSKTVKGKMQDAIESEFNKNYKIEKITKSTTRSLQQSQPNPKEYYSIKEEMKFKVRVNGKNFLFKASGDLD